jgi:hypothetical protein
VHAGGGSRKWRTDTKIGAGRGREKEGTASCRAREGTEWGGGVEGWGVEMERWRGVELTKEDAKEVSDKRSVAR